MDGRVPAQVALHAAVTFWTDFVAKCVSQRLETAQFEVLVQIVYSKHALPAGAIADFFLRPQPSNCVSLDPRIPPYIQVLTQLRYVDAPSILRALYKYSTLHSQVPDLTARGPDHGQDRNLEQGRGPAPTRWKGSSWAEEVMFYHVIKLLVEGSALRDTQAALDMVAIISKWMALFASVSTIYATGMLMELQDPQLRHEMDVSRGAFVPLLLRLVDNEALVKALGKPSARGHRKEFSESLAKFVQTLQPVPQIVEKLDHFRTEVLGRFDPVDKKKQVANAAMDDLLDSTMGLDNLVIQDIPIPATRAGLYIYLNASLIGRPLIDDHALFSYLHNRYQGNIQSCAVDLVLASFDVLANAVFRNEGPRDAHLLRSYLINKVPLLLCQICPPGFASPSAEFCITEALNQIDTSVFPTASLMFDESRNNNPYTESLIHSWRYEDDQGEYQPVYEEFGSILLLVLAFAYRYNLSPGDMGLQSADSNVAKIIGRGHISQELDELSEAELGHINGWIHGLFDSEAGGLGDDLMSSCPPQEFYFLIATIFQNIVGAYTQGYLTDDSLRAGIESIRFLADYLWVEQKEQQSIIKVLQLILLPSSISGEANTMLGSVKTIIAKPLEHSLRAYQRQNPKNQNIEPLLKALKDSLPLSRRTGGAEVNELEAWATTSTHCGLVGGVKNTISALIQWSLHPVMTAMPASYTHRQIIGTLKIVGATRLLRVMVEETRQHAESASGNVVYDVVSALICAPNVMNEPPAPSTLIDEAGNMWPLLQRRLTLREALKTEADEVRKLRRKDPALAEAVVRLHRRVEAHMVVPPPPAMLQAAGMQLDLGGGATSLGDAMVAAAAAAAVGVQADSSMAVDGVVGLDMGMGGGVSSGLGLGGMAGANGGLDASGEPDLFSGIDTGGLDTAIEMFDWSDNMDLGH
ncbi:Mediator of RNA polymerase II transcription subunit 5 [Escovopsis weberi]|uniref:Mediator of RNA polymerase II transcription subunit 5 n=1 Tax=Escovopsis weberi TaxID=150374 RepID=A0A0M8N2D0_ESCWE|nr:Mediator of RNA polymerase II transcription subunit 5 [Escovopsis weberi]